MPDRVLSSIRRKPVSFVSRLWSRPTLLDKIPEAPRVIVFSRRELYNGGLFMVDPSVFCRKMSSNTHFGCCPTYIQCSVLQDRRSAILFVCGYITGIRKSELTDIRWPSVFCSCWRNAVTGAIPANCELPDYHPVGLAKVPLRSVMVTGNWLAAKSPCLIRLRKVAYCLSSLLWNWCGLRIPTRSPSSWATILTISSISTSLGRSIAQTIRSRGQTESQSH